MLDAGDLFFKAHKITDAQRPGVVATAEFLIDQLGEGKCEGMVLGDRDLALGADALGKLRARAKFPFLTANLLKQGTQQPYFDDHVIVERAGRKIGVFGLTAKAGRRGGNEQVPWVVVDHLPVAKAQVEALKAKGADIIVVLAHLGQKQEEELAEKVGGITAVLGGGSVKMMKRPAIVDDSFVAQAFSKGKYVSILSLHMWEGSTLDKPFVAKDRRQSIEAELRQLDARIVGMQRRLEQQTSKDAAGENARVASQAKGKAALQPKAPTRSRGLGPEYYEKQLVKLRADKDRLALELSQVPEADNARDFVTYELVPLGRGVAHEPGVDAAVKAFRVKWPDPAKAKKGAKRPTGDTSARSPAKMVPRVRPPASSKKALQPKITPTP